MKNLIINKIGIVLVGLMVGSLAQAFSTENIYYNCETTIQPGNEKTNTTFALENNKGVLRAQVVYFNAIGTHFVDTLNQRPVGEGFAPKDQYSFQDTFLMMDSPTNTLIESLLRAPVRKEDNFSGAINNIIIEPGSDLFTLKYTQTYQSPALANQRYTIIGLCVATERQLYSNSFNQYGHTIQKPTCVEQICFWN